MRSNKIKWLYVVTYRKRAQLIDKKFPSEEEALKLTARLKRNKVQYVYWKAQPNPRWRQIIETMSKYLYAMRKTR